MPLPPMESPEFQRFAGDLYRRLIQEGSIEATIPGFHDRNLVIRPHSRQRSTLQRVVLSAVRSGLMRRDSRGRFTGLDPSVKVGIRKVLTARQRRDKPTRAQVRADQRATLAILASAE